jgi:tRNA-binding EMAP/Myf-like protein
MPFVVGHVIDCSNVSGKSNLKRCEIDIGAEEPIVVVSNAPNVRQDTHTVVALVGTEVEIDGEMVVVKKTSVGSIMSEGILCDTLMLGWGSGSVGNCVQVPMSFVAGSEGILTYFFVSTFIIFPRLT